MIAAWLAERIRRLLGVGTPRPFSAVLDAALAEVGTTRIRLRAYELGLRAGDPRTPSTQSAVRRTLCHRAMTEREEKQV